MISPEEKLKSLGIELPVAPEPLGSYIPFIRTGNLVFLSGLLPLKHGRLLRNGKVGKEVRPEEAMEDAKIIVINALAILKSHLGNLDNVKRCVKITGYIASSENFTEQPKILNAASNLLYEIFGEKGKHARVAIGVNVLPLNSPVEIEFIFEVS